MHSQVVKVLKDVLPNNFIEGIYKENTMLLDYPQLWRHNVDLWQKELLNETGIVYIRSLLPEHDMFIKMILLKKGILNKEQIEKLKINIHVWTNESKINWHDDSNYEGAGTIYLNKVWKDNWGGKFLWEIDGKESSYTPVHNEMLIIKAPTQHCTTEVSADADFRQTIQLFW